MYIVLARRPGGDATLLPVGEDLAAGEPREVPAGELPGAVLELEQDRPRWVWADWRDGYPELLRAGVSVERCHDLRLCAAILRYSAVLAAPFRSRLGEPADGPGAPAGASGAPTLFDAEPAGPGSAERDAGTLLEELAAQLSAVERVADPGARGRLRLLLAAESSGGLIAAEMSHAGLPWSREVHTRLLTELLGERTPPGVRPARMEDLATQIRDALGAPRLNPDSPLDVLRALHRAGIGATSTRSWELREVRHPAIEPLLRYKKLSRLLTASGWAWLDAWANGGRFRPDYVPGGVVTGRWASQGGGALQLPKILHPAVVADPGWKLVSADASQLEPRILAALSGDTGMARAGAGRDLYQGVAEAGFGGDRSHAKVALLGAMYGATTGESGRLMPRLSTLYPRAVRFVEDAARTGEAGGTVTARLGRSCPPPGPAWQEVQQRAQDPGAEPAAERRARRQARRRGRFTRNFVVQGSAADWASCWLAGVRIRLRRMAAGHGGAMGPEAPALVLFLHDEIMVHCPAALAEEVRAAVEEAAVEAGRLLFGDAPVEFPVHAAVVDHYDEAK